MLLSLRGFVAGEVLYRDVWSVYGPFYYELFGGLFSLTGWSIDTDAGRSIVIVLWVATSLMLGLAAHRLTGRLALGVSAMAVSFAALHVLVNEPMHPQGACVLLFGGFALVAVLGLGGRAACRGRVRRAAGGADADQGQPGRLRDSRGRPRRGPDDRASGPPRAGCGGWSSSPSSRCRWPSSSRTSTSPGSANCSCSSCWRGSR